MFDDLLTHMGISNSDQHELGGRNLITHFTDNFEICGFFLISNYIFSEDKGRSYEWAGAVEDFYKLCHMGLFGSAPGGSH